MTSTTFGKNFISLNLLFYLKKIVVAFLNALFNGLPDRIPLVNFLNAHFKVLKMFCDKIINIVDIYEIQISEKSERLSKRPKECLLLLLAFFERLVVLNFPYSNKKSNK